jgi:GDPmannose 4,6-dehydratase
VDPALYRPAEVDHLRGDATLARKCLGWAPTVDFRTMVTGMVEADLERHRGGVSLPPTLTAPVLTDG